MARAAQVKSEKPVKVLTDRVEYHSDHNNWLIYTLIAQGTAFAACVLVIIALLTENPEPRYFPSRADGGMTRLIPLNEPMLAPSSVLSWAGQAATEAFSFDYVSYRGQLEEAAVNFTPEGWRSFLKALEDSRNIDLVIQRKLIVTAKLSGAPVILTEGVVNGVYAWRVELPILIETFAPNDNINGQSISVSMTISRVPVLEYPNGIAITQFVAQR